MDVAFNMVYHEIIDFIASGTTPESVIAFKPSEATQVRVDDLLSRNRTSGYHYMNLEHIMRLAKPRARIYSSGR